MPKCFATLRDFIGVVIDIVVWVGHNFQMLAGDIHRRVSVTRNVQDEHD